MPLQRQKLILRADVRAQPEALFLFGDNMVGIGLKGQAREMRGEPNAVGIPTKWSPGRAPHDYFSDRDMAAFAAVVEERLERVEEHLRRGGLVIVPEAGLGSGLSQLPKKAPMLNEWLKTRLARLEKS